MLPIAGVPVIPGEGYLPVVGSIEAVPRARFPTSRNPCAVGHAAGESLALGARDTPVQLGQALRKPGSRCTRPR